MWKSAEHVAPVVWWKGICSSWPPSQVAVEILSLPATSAACEHSFSTYGNIHTAKRNHLDIATAMKLVYIAQNLKFCATAQSAQEDVKSECDEPDDNMEVNEVDQPLDAFDDGLR